MKSIASEEGNKKVFPDRGTVFCLDVAENKKCYKDSLGTYQFSNKDEAKLFGIVEPVIEEEETFTALEAPFAFKRIEKQKVTKEIEYCDEFSSESETDDVYYGDIKMDIDLTMADKCIANDVLTLERNVKYGLVGRNGIGKSTLLRAIKKRLFGIPKGIKIHMIKQDYVSDQTVLEYISGVDSTEGVQKRLEAEGTDSPADKAKKLKEIKLESKESQKNIVLNENNIINKTLDALGFTVEKQHTTLRNLSGGWRMRAQLARAIIKNPDLLLLDEPTNFLDIEGIDWLERQIPTLKTVIIVSHDRNFLNCVDSIILFKNTKLIKYKGNFESYVNQIDFNIKKQIKEFDEQKRDKDHLQKFIDRFRASTRSTQAQSRLKIVEKMKVVEMPVFEPVISFNFDCTKQNGTLVEVEELSFGYKNFILEGINLHITDNTRIVLVGKNGEGKSTFLKLLAGRILMKEEKEDAYSNYLGALGSVEAKGEGNSKKDGPSKEVTLGFQKIKLENIKLKNKGTISYNKAKIGYFAQHHIDHLNMDDYIFDLIRPYKNGIATLDYFGLNVGNQRVGTLSGGQKSRLAFALLSLAKPNVLILDEPTNHLDIEMIDALALALKKFEGAVIAVSHDLVFVEKVFDQVYICENKKITEFKGSVFDYKRMLKKK